MVCDLALRLMGGNLSDSSGSSGYPSIAVLSINPRIDAIGHKQTHAAEQKGSLFDQFVGAADQRQRHCDAERLGGLEIDDQLDFRSQLNRQVGGLLALKNFAGVNATLTECIVNICAVAYQAACHNSLAPRIKHRHRVAPGKRYDLIVLGVVEQIASYEKRADALLN
jgi:hypothetical protein